MVFDSDEAYLWDEAIEEASNLSMYFLKRLDCELCAATNSCRSFLSCHQR
jgi:hypothetical protein